MTLANNRDNKTPEPIDSKPQAQSIASQASSSMWVALMSDGHRITRELAVLGAIQAYMTANSGVTLFRLTWFQNGHSYRLDYANGYMMVDSDRLSVPHRIPFDPIRPIASTAMAKVVSTSPDPSPGAGTPVGRKLGVRLRLVDSAYIDMYIYIKLDNSWEWHVEYSVDESLVNGVSGVAYWKIFYGDATVITARMMDFEDTPTENVQCILLFFPEGHPAYPRTRLHGHDHYWKDGDLWGFSFNDPAYTRGHVKNGAWVSNDIWRWILYATKRDYTVDGYNNPSPQW